LVPLRPWQEEKIKKRDEKLVKKAELERQRIEQR
jgi:hypothetical protein